MLHVFKRSRNAHITFLFGHFTLNLGFFLQKSPLNFHFNTRNHFRDEITGLFMNTRLLGGLSLHLNHLIASRMANYDWPFGTLPFRLFGSNLDTRDLETYPRTYSGHFEICQFLTIPGPFEYFSENGWSQKIKVFSMKERSLPPYRFSFRRRGP